MPTQLRKTYIVYLHYCLRYHAQPVQRSSLVCPARLLCLASNKTYKHRSLAETAIRHACIMQSNAAMPAWASLSRKAVIWAAVLHSHWYCTRPFLPPAKGRFEPGDIHYVRGVHHCRGIEGHRCMTFLLVAQRFTQAVLCLKPI
jgi:hypothetical protein